MQRTRILLVNWTRRRVGGTEDYLASIIPSLHARGYELAFIAEVDSQLDRKSIALPEGVAEWCVSHIGAAKTLQFALTWKPDIIYAHGELKVSFEKELLQLAPAVYFAHNYYGTCISGLKAHKWPTPRPCKRTLGWPCLVNYFPRRCGGLSPITMFRRYRNERGRLENLKLYQGIITHSEHMRQEYIKHGISPSQLYNFSYEVGSPKRASGKDSSLVSIDTETSLTPKPNRLLFLGRMEKLKGGLTMIDSVELAHRTVKGPIQVTFAGDGPDRRKWQLHARNVEDKCPGCSFVFPGWLSNEQVSWHLDNTDVLVVPSLWPEPFGRVGIQAGQHGVPVAAFAVGGIPEWLKDGVNGRLAPGDPPTAEGLAQAVWACLNDKRTHDFHAAGQTLAARFSTDTHVDRLADVFNKALQNLSHSERKKSSHA